MEKCFPYYKRKSNAKIRLFCFPYAGGAASIFYSWAEQIGPDIEVLPVQLPGRENRIYETPLKNMEEIIFALLSDMLPYLDMPFAFFGHSMGSLLCFEIIRKLRKNYDYVRPKLLVVSAHRAPQIDYDEKHIAHLPGEIFWKEMYERYHAIPKEVFENQEMMNLLLPALQADMTIEENYCYSHEPPLQIPIVVFAGQDDATISQENLEAWYSQTNITNRQIYTFPGDHFFLKKSSHIVPTLTKILQTI